VPDEFGQSVDQHRNPAVRYLPLHPQQQGCPLLILLIVTRADWLARIVPMAALVRADADGVVQHGELAVRS